MAHEPSDFADVFSHAFIRLSEELTEAKKLITLLEQENKQYERENQELKKRIKSLLGED